MIEFIFMLTRDDRTLTDARAVYASIAGERRHATSAARTSGCRGTSCRRSWTTSARTATPPTSRSSPRRAEATLASARAAAEIGPDYLIGGTLIEPVQEILAGTGIKFFPYVGQIVDHPCLLRGTIDEIADDARRAESLGVDGINLLAYRYDGDVDALVEAVVGATSLPVIAAGSVDSPTRIQALAERGVWAFTIGTAALDGVLVDGAPLDGQLR